MAPDQPDRAYIDTIRDETSTSSVDISGLEAAVARVGDRWTLLIINALLDGPHRFNQLQEVVSGIAPNVLSSRLRQLEHDGVIVANLYSRRPPRFAYQLSAGGAELAGALRLLAQWGVDRAGGEPLHHDACGTPVEARWYCPTCERVVDPSETPELRFL